MYRIIYSSQYGVSEIVKYATLTDALYTLYALRNIYCCKPRFNCVTLSIA